MKSMERRCNNKIKLFAVIIMLAFLTSCESKLMKEIVGQWSEVAGAENIELFKDGKIVLTSPWTGTENGMNGKYKFVEKDKISVEFNTSGNLQGPFIVQVSVKDDKLTWIMPDGKVSEYERVK